MANIKQMQQVRTAQPLTEEQKRIKIAQFLQQKREAFSINILCSLCQNYPESLHNESELIDRAVSLADKLMEKLYPLPEEADKTNA